MDPITLAFYAIVCGCLSVFAPSIGGVMQRLVVGAIVGLIAATALPFLHASLTAG